MGSERLRRRLAVIGISVLCMGTAATARIAIESVLDDEPLPAMESDATVAYGLPHRRDSTHQDVED